MYNSQLSNIKAEQNLLRARIDLNIFLNIDKNTVINCIVPQDLPGIEISMDEAISLAMQNNATLTNLHIRELQSEREVSQAKAENRFTSTLHMSYGLNGTNTNLNNSYQNLGQRQSVNLGFNIPIVDWGEGKGAIAVAQSNLEVGRIKVQQEKIAFEQSVSVDVLEFNLQKKQVENSAKADTIAQKGYDISYEIFKLGKLDVINLNQSRNDQENARKAYITSLQNYWIYWYRIRQETLFDFQNDITLSEDFDALINQ
ncbi:MAG: TolC family protein [Bacteroidales bacterium]|nr:TolC family protein [Bacteroidales bacterium]